MIDDPYKHVNKTDLPDMGDLNPEEISEVIRMYLSQTSGVITPAEAAGLIDICTKALDKVPGHVQLIIQYCNMLAFLGRYEECMDAYDRLSDSNDVTHIGPMLNFAYNWLVSTQYEDDRLPIFDKIQNKWPLLKRFCLENDELSALLECTVTMIRILMVPPMSDRAEVFEEVQALCQDLDGYLTKCRDGILDVELSVRIESYVVMARATFGMGFEEKTFAAIEQLLEDVKRHLSLLVHEDYKNVIECVLECCSPEKCNFLHTVPDLLQNLATCKDKDETEMHVFEVVHKILLGNHQDAEMALNELKSHVHSNKPENDENRAGLDEMIQGLTQDVAELKGR